METTHEVANLIIAALAKRGIINQFVQVGIVGKVGQESNFIPKFEYSYHKTPNARLRETFGDRLKPFNEEQLTALKTDDVKFYDFMYGGRYGNTAPGDGWKYRGGGLNQITFKDAYIKYGALVGKDLVNHPELVNQIDIAADVCAAYFQDTFAIAKSNGTLKSKLGVGDLSEVKDINTGLLCAIQANAGFGTNIKTGFFKTVYDQSMAHIKTIFNLQSFTS